MERNVLQFKSDFIGWQNQKFWRVRSNSICPGHITKLHKAKRPDKV